MSNHKGKNPMFNDETIDPLLTSLGFDDESIDPLLTSLRNLSLQNINNNFEQGESSTTNNNNNFNFHIGQISLGSSQHSRATSRAHMFNPSWITQPDAFSGQTSASPWSIEEFNNHQLLRKLFDMMTCHTRHEFINYLQTICSNETAVKERILSKIGLVLTRNHSTFLDIATNLNGSRALVALFKRSLQLDMLIYKAVYVNFTTLMLSKYGRFLIVPTIRAVGKPWNEWLYELTYKNTLFLARHETGCIALNEVFKEIKGRFREQILDMVARNAHWLSFDHYGTHVVQYFLTLENPSATHAIAEKLCGSFFRLASERQGSFVVEKCLRSEFGIWKVLEEFRGNDKEWIRMANDKFGNFVAQSALKVMKERGMIGLLIEFVEKLRPHFREMQFGFGKNTLRFIQEEI